MDASPECVQCGSALSVYEQAWFGLLCQECLTPEERAAHADEYAEYERQGDS